MKTVVSGLGANDLINMGATSVQITSKSYSPTFEKLVHCPWMEKENDTKENTSINR